MNDNLIDKKEVRYNSLKDAFNRLSELLNEDISKQNDIIKKGIIDGIIQRFEFTFELMWKVLKDYMESIGFSDFSQGPKGILKFAFKNGIIEDEKAYSDMLNDRNTTTYIYDEKIALKIYNNIKAKHIKSIEKVIKYLEKEKYLS